MIVLLLALLVEGTLANTGATTPHLVHIDDLPHIGHFDDAQHRGPAWEDYTTDSEGDTSLDGSSSSDTVVDSSENSSEFGETDLDSTSASSFETKERKMLKRTNRVCSPCPHEMLKKYKNIGIKWICGGYQRARRTFKSSCMMRYRNCEDGTMFVKLHNNRCKNDTYHGNHWFYIYKV